MKSKKVFFVVISFFVLLLLGFWFFFEESTISRREIDNEPTVVVGNLMIDNPGLSENSWHLSYERPGSSGLVVKITKEDGIPCLGSESECLDFFQKNSDITGKRVEVEGFFNENREELAISKINFLDINYGCSFDFSDFPAKKSLTIDQYLVDFSTRPEAEDFKTRIEETVKSGPNFGGKFVYAEWGCGTNCGAGAVVNPKSGEIIEYGIMNSHGVEFYQDSNLLIVNPPQMLEYIRPGDLFEEETSRYYLITDEGLLFLCEQ